MIRVLLVDDQRLVRTGFSMILSVADDIEVVGEAADGAAAVAAAHELRPDVVLMDVQMPGMDGITATGQIVAADLAKVVILTTFDRDDYLFAGLEAGASGFLLKNTDPEHLVEAVRAVADGHALLAPEVTRRVIEARVRGEAGARGTSQDASGMPRAGSGGLPGGIPGGLSGGLPGGIPEGGAARRGAGAGEADPLTEVRRRGLALLTERERQVLGLMARGLANAEIAAELVLGEATVKTHVSSVLAKLHLRDRIQAVVFAYECGLA